MGAKELEQLKKSFWEGKWQASDTPWHFDGSDDLCEKHAPALKKGLPDEADAFVPLCGNTTAVRTLFDLGFRVIALDFVKEAIDQLKVEQFRDEKTLSSERLQFVVGDVFDYGENTDQRFHLIYDRAALIALEPPLRQKYASLLTELLLPGGYLLLEFFSTAYHVGSSPPFSIDYHSVLELFPTLSVERFSSYAMPASERRFSDSGYSQYERNWLTLKK